MSAGVNVKALQRMLGHSSAKETLDTYSDLFDEDLKSVAVAINAAGPAPEYGQSVGRVSLDFARPPEQAKETKL